MLRISPFLVACALLLVAASDGPLCVAGCEPVVTDAPRTLVLALDGVPLRSVVEAREMGAYASFETPRPMISTFPSVTGFPKK